ncbi:MAG: tryptophan-rich sensory protein [Clostridia bacterium]|nr:tryptophan-rich sensory protein [Clostridia bacterium]
MKIQWKKLIGCLAIPLGVGVVSALLTRNSMEQFSSLRQPPLSPPGWLFPVVWTVLFILMGIASYLVIISGHPARSKTALTVYGVQLAFNFLWSILFFNWQLYWVALIWLIALWGLIWLNMVLFYRLSKPAGCLLIPYLIWVTFAGYLNTAIALLN